MKEKYLKLLEVSYPLSNQQQPVTQNRSRLAYLGDEIFDFVTYDDVKTELFTKKALEVCSAINIQDNFRYINNPEGYLWYLLVINMTFFDSILNWGTSARGAFWDLPDDFKLESCGLFTEDGKQILELPLTTADWKSFVAAMNEFVSQ